MLRLVLVSTVLALALSCSNLRLIADDGSVVVGRSLEFSTFPESFNAGNELWTEPRNTEHVMPELPNCADRFTFTSEHAMGRFRVALFGTHLSLIHI